MSGQSDLDHGAAGLVAVLRHRRREGADVLALASWASLKSNTDSTWATIWSVGVSVR